MIVYAEMAIIYEKNFQVSESVWIGIGASAVETRIGHEQMAKDPF